MTTDEKIDVLSQRFDDLMKAVTGDRQFGSPGYKQRIESNERMVQEHRNRMNRMETEHRSEMNQLEKEHQENINRIDSRFDKVYNKVIGICIGVSVVFGAAGWLIQNSVETARAQPIPMVRQLYVPKLGHDIPIKIDTSKALADSSDE